MTEINEEKIAAYLRLRDLMQTVYKQKIELTNTEDKLMQEHRTFVNSLTAEEFREAVRRFKDKSPT